MLESAAYEQDFVGLKVQAEVDTIYIMVILSEANPIHVPRYPQPGQHKTAYGGEG
jgi:hypothetical protein